MTTPAGALDDLRRAFSGRLLTDADDMAPHLTDRRGISTIPTFMESPETALRERSPQVMTRVFGHIGDGNLHFNVLPASPDACGGSKRSPGRSTPRRTIS